MKTKNIAYLFAGFLAMTLLSCSDDSEPLIMQEEVSTTMLDYQTVTDAQRALLPRSSQQMDDGAVQPDRKGEKGRDHREWYDVIGNGRFKNFDTGSLLSPGELYAIDPDGVNAYIFKFFFPEEFRAKTELYEGLRVVVTIIERGNGWMTSNSKVFDGYPFQFDDSFRFPRSLINDWDIISYNIYSDHPTTECLFRREIQFSDLVIIKQRR